jgi:glycosyltransferase involved in cell wall biosynthesis
MFNIMNQDLSPRVWIINQFANTPDLPGHTRQYDLGSYLAQKGCGVTVFASDYNLSKRTYQRLKGWHFWKCEHYGNLKWCWLWVSPYRHNNWLRYLNLISFCLSLFLFSWLVPRPDLIIASSPQLPAAWLCMKLAQIRKVQFWVEVRDLWPQVLIDLGGKSSDSLVIKVLSWMESQVYQKSAQVIVLSEGSIQYVEKRGAKTVVCLPNGSDLGSISLNSLQDRDIQWMKKQFGINPNQFCLIYAGAHGLANGLEVIVEAARILQEKAPQRFQILLVGDGTEKPQLQQLAIGVENIEFRDPIPKQKIHSLLRSADGLILTLKNIPLFKYGVSPNKLYDYYAVAKPVIVAVGGFINQEVEDHHLGFAVDPENPTQLAQAILQLAATPAQVRQSMGQHARTLAENSYSREVVAEKFYQLIQTSV